MPKVFHKHRCIFKPNLNLLIKGDRFKYHAKPRNEVIPNTIAFSKIIKAHFFEVRASIRPPWVRFFENLMPFSRTKCRLFFKKRLRSSKKSSLRSFLFLPWVLNVILNVKEFFAKILSPWNLNRSVFWKKTYKWMAKNLDQIFGAKIFSDVRF